MDRYDSEVNAVKRILRLLALLLIAALLGGCAAETGGPVQLFAVNVGKGDALVLKVGDWVGLIDAGKPKAMGRVKAALARLGVEKLDAVFLTHTDNDHAGGLEWLAWSSIPVGSWYASAMFTGVKAKKHPMLLAAALRGQDVQWLERGDALSLGESGARLVVLAPASLFDDKDDNNSLVMMLESAQGRMLLAGDMELPEEAELLSQGDDLRCAVLKVPNHGDDDTTSAELAKAAGAQLAVISTDSQEKPGTPDPGVWAEYAIVPFGRQSDICRVLSSVVVRDGGLASTNLYSYAGAPRPGTLALPPPGARVPPQRYSALPPDPGRPVLSWKADANGVEGFFRYIRPDDSAHVRCARSWLSGGLFETELAWTGAWTQVSAPFSGGIARSAYRRDGSWREVERRTGEETRLLSYSSSGDLADAALSSPGATVFYRAAHDSRHRVVSVGEGLNAAPRRFTALAWDDRLNVPRRVVSPSGRVSEWEWTDEGVVVHGAGAGDSRAVTRVFLDANERVAAAVGPDGGRVDLARDESGYVTNAASSCLPPVSLAYDALGRVSSVSMPGPGGTARTASLVRNRRGRPLSVTRFDGTAETYEYDGNGRRVTRRVDALGREDVYEWVLGLPVHAGRVVGGATNSLFGAVHDRQLNVVAITDPLGRNAETYVLDANERVVAVTNLEGQAMAREYLVGGLVASETRFDGTRVQYGYDRDGNLASVAYPGETFSFSYDPDGLMTSAANSSGTITNSYDAATGWLVSSVGADGTAVSYSRRNGGGVSAMTSAAGTIAYAYDAADRMTQVDSPAGTLNFGYCGWNGRISASTNSHGFVVQYAYDIMDRATNIAWRTASGATLGGVEYEYDAIGRIVARSLGVGTNSFDRAYAYDDLDRLASDGGVAYTYDAAGNRMTRTENDARVTYTIGVGDRLASWIGGAYTHDAAGVFAEGYEYDALGRRVSTTTLEGTTRHVYDDNWQVVADVDTNGNVIASYVWGDGIDHLLAVNVGGASYYPLTDVQGTVWGYVDSQNNVVARWRYDAWGNVVDEYVAPSSAALARLRYRFQCREWSAATGLIHFRMRWYDSETGRWLSKDPIGLSGGLNLYVFCGGDSVNYVDLFGLCVREDVFNRAKGYIGSHDWDKSAGFGIWKNAYKCNKFVADMYNSGRIINLIPTGIFGTKPPTAKNWYVGSVPNGFMETKNPKPGDIATNGEHMGIVSGNNTTISATCDQGVVENDWGFRIKGAGRKDKTKFYTYGE